MLSYREKLKKYLIRVMTILVIAVASVLLISFMLYFYLEQDTQLKKDTSQLNSFYTSKMSAAKELVNEMTSKEFNAEREVYYHFYMIQSRYGLDGQFILLNQQGQEIYNSDFENSLPNTYLQLVTEDDNDEGVFTYYDDRSQSSLVFYKKDDKQSAIYLLSAPSFIGDDIAINTSYLLIDSYQHILDRSSSFPVEPNDISSFPFLLDEDQLFLIKKSKLLNNLTLITATLFLPLIPLLGISFGVVLLLILLMILIAAYIAKQMTIYSMRSIDRLVEETSSIALGDQEEIVGEYEQEFTYLSQAMNQMLREIRQLNEEQLVLEKEKLNYERKMLEAQFNPHFLYNTLETIRITSQFDPKICSDLIRSLTKILRYSLNTNMSDATLKEDMEIIHQFLRVNQIRFPDFSYQINYPEELAELKIPRLFLLSAVENSIKYGRDQRADLFIQIIVQNNQEDIQFEVIDNGPGFTQEAHDHLLNQLQKNIGHSGLMNSIKRLRFLYPEAQLFIPDVEEGSILIYRIRKE